MARTCCSVLPEASAESKIRSAQDCHILIREYTIVEVTKEWVERSGSYIIHLIKVQVWMSAMTKSNNQPVLAKKEPTIIPANRNDLLFLFLYTFIML